MSVGLSPAQHAFAAALLDPAAEVPAGVRAGGSPRASSSFAIYRNNVAASLTNVLMARFPVVVRLIGHDAFRALAWRFVAHHPPRSPVLIHYGDAFPQFLRSLSESAMAEYLADIARLELARGHAFHAADAAPVPVECFAAIASERLPKLQVLLHPSATLLRSRFPVVSAWEVSQPGSDQAIRCWRGEDAMVLRPGSEVQVMRLGEGSFAFLSALAGGATLQTAIEAGFGDNQEFNLAANLALLAGSGVAVGLQ